MREMRIDVAIGMAELRYFAGLALQLRGETIPVAHGRLNYTLREPFGVVGRIVPFNHPLMFATMKIGAPLVAGNTVVLKPSEHTSLSALALAEELARHLPARRRQRRHRATAPRRATRSSRTPTCRRLAFIGLAETGPRDPGARRRRGRQERDARAAAARTRSWSSPTPTSTRRSTASCAA